MTAPASPRARLVVAAPLAVALLLAGWLLWTRGDAARQGSFCTNATVEITALLRQTEEPGNLDRDQARHLQDALERVDQIDVDRLLPGAPASLADELETIVSQLPEHRRDVATAREAGEPEPDRPAELTDAFGTVLATYYRTCV